MQGVNSSTATYTYLFDQFLRDKRYEAEVNRIESRILELGLNGKIEKLSALKNVKEILRTAVARGSDTIVAVGNDHTLSKVVDVVAGERITLGFLPVGSPNDTAALLGIPRGVSACDVLSQRIIANMDIGQVNDDQHFLFSVEIPSNDVEIECDGKFRVSTDAENGKFMIQNLGSVGGARRNPSDGKLETVVVRQRSGFLPFGRRGFDEEAVLPMKRATIHSRGDRLSLVLDGTNVVKTPATVTVAPKKLRVIVGKGRQF